MLDLVKKGFRQRFVDLLPENNFFRGVGVLVGGTAGAQVSVLLAAPLLTRLYTPEDFGALAVYAGILSLFSVIASLKYELAIPLPEDESNVVAITLLSLMLVVAITALSAGLIFFWGESLTALLQVSALSSYLWLLPVGIFFSGCYQVFSYWAIRLQEFPLLAQTNIKQQLSTIAVQLFCYKFGGVGLLFGQAFGQGVGVFTLARKIFLRNSWRKPPINKIKYVAWRYRNFPLFSTGGGLLNTAGMHVPPLLFAAMFGASSAGLYALANRVISIPMAVIGQAVGQVFLSNAAIDHREGRLSKLVLAAHKALTKIILPPVIFLILFGPLSFAMVFGEEWRLSGEVASWLALWMLVSFSTSPLSSVFAVIERQDLGLFMQAVLFVVRVLGILPGFYCQDFMVGVMTFSIFSIFGYLAYQYVAFLSLGLNLKDLLKGYRFAIPLVIFSLLVKISLGEYLSIYYVFPFGILAVIFYYRVMNGLNDD